MKKEFNMSYKQDIIDGKVKVVTKDNRPVEILKWNRIDDEGRHIIALIHHSDECEDVYHFYEDGRCDDMYGNDAYNLYVLTDEPESEDERIRNRLLDFFNSFRMTNGVKVKWEGLDVQKVVAWLEKQGEQKPAWSEGDRILQDSSISYLCNLRDTFETKGWDKEPIQKCINWLRYRIKFLKPHQQWKPSELQLECLDDAIKHYQSNGFRPVILMELLEELKKL